MNIASKKYYHIYLFYYTGTVGGFKRILNM